MVQPLRLGLSFDWLEALASERLQPIWLQPLPFERSNASGNSVGIAALPSCKPSVAAAVEDSAGAIVADANADVDGHADSDDDAVSYAVDVMR